jgi:hypothetical protein
MYKVYYMIPKSKPVLVAEFINEDYAQVVVDFGNTLFNDGREFWVENEEAEEAEEEFSDISRKELDAELLRDFDRTEARAINAGLL